MSDVRPPTSADLDRRALVGAGAAALLAPALRHAGRTGSTPDGPAAGAGWPFQGGDEAFGGGPLFGSVEAGLAEVADGAFFGVGGGARVHALLYRKRGGRAVPIAEFATRAQVDEVGLSPEMFGAAPTYDPARDDLAGYPADLGVLLHWVEMDEIQ